jgi:protein-L-isoaspartate(D-aspartate) O-methyltransferase
MPDFAAARVHMVEGQVRPNKVTDPALIAALSDIPREAFAAPACRDIAYADGDLTVVRGRAVPSPMVFARMVQEAGVRPSDSVLDLAPGTGYSTAVLARIARAVVAVEPDAALAASAEGLMRDLGCANIQVAHAPAEAGWPERAPFDVIVIEGAVERVPDVLTGQLADGGRLVACVVGADGVGRATLYLRTGNVVAARVLFEAKPCLAPGFSVTKEFAF